MSSLKAHSLAARRRKLREQFNAPPPVLRASLIERFTQCRRAGCKCVQRQKHGPAYYLTVSNAQDRTRQGCVSKDLRPVAEQWVRNYHQALSVLEEISGINLELIRLKEAPPDS